jgi:GAF domain-containing protein
MNTDVTEQIEAERVRTFLLGLEDRLRPLLDPAEVIYAVAEELGRYLEVNRGGYAEVDAIISWSSDPGRTAKSRTRSGGTQLTASIPPLSSPSCGAKPSLRRCRSRSAHQRGYRGAYSALEMRSIITKPLFKDGELVGHHDGQPAHARKWTAAEARLVGEVGERAWASVARARAEARLRQSQALLAAFMENAPSACT